MQFTDYQIHDKIKKIAQKEGISMGDLHKMLDIGPNHLRKACNNGSLRIDVLLQVSEVLGVDIKDFFGSGIEGPGGQLPPAGSHSDCRSQLEAAGKEIALLRDLVREKDEVIKLLKSK